MKKCTCLILCIVMLFAMSGCSKDNFMDVYAFTYYYNKLTKGNELRMEDYLIRNGTYSLSLKEGGTHLNLSLEASDDGKIEEIRLLIPKVDENGSPVTVREQDVSFFSGRLADILGAYTDLTSEECVNVISEMKLDKPSSYTAEGELTLTKRDWHMVWYSIEIASVFIIYNIHLHPIEKTEKPVSKPDFGNTAYTRAE